MARIGIDVTALVSPNPGGIGTALYYTLKELAELGGRPEIVLYSTTPPRIPFTTDPLDLPFPLRLGSGLAAKSNIIWMQTGVNRLLYDDKIEVFWGPRHLLPLLAKGIATVATVHDLWHHYHPEQQPFVNRKVNSWLIPMVARRADMVLAISSATGRDLVRTLDIPPHRVAVVPLGVDSRLFSPQPVQEGKELLARLGISRPFVLALDVYNPRKNFVRSLEGFAQLPDSLRDGMEIVAMGEPRSTASHFDPETAARRLGVQQHLRLVASVSPQELSTLYSSASVLAFPSIYEGFGMPVLEAMACGCPVVTSDRSSLPEVAGDAALMVDPEDPVALSDALQRLLTDGQLRSRLVERGMKRAGSFSWRRTALKTLEVLKLARQRHAASNRA